MPLRQRIIAEYERHRPERLLKDAASGISLIQDLKALRPHMCCVPIKATQPKDVRIVAASAHFENRQVLFPQNAPWLDQCLAKVLGYPSAKHNDVIDSISQYINWVRGQTTDLFAFEFWHNDNAPGAPDGERFVRWSGREELAS